MKNSVAFGNAVVLLSLNLSENFARMAQFNTDLLKEYIAPAIDVKPECETSLLDLGSDFAEAEYWFGNYFLNSVFNGKFSGETKLYTESLIARIKFAFDGYQSARLKTLEYSLKWKIGAPGINRYLFAINEWENVFLNLQIIYDLLSKMFGATYSGREDRARLIANRIKHVSEDIRDQRLNGPGLPMWLTKDGFSTIGPSVTFEEMAGMVCHLAKVADCLFVPSEASQRFAALDLELAGDPNYVII